MNEEEISPSERAKLWEELLSHPAWQWYKAALTGQINTRAALILGDMVVPEGEKFNEVEVRGERAGLRLALTIAETAAEESLVELAQFIKENQGEQAATDVV